MQDVSVMPHTCVKVAEGASKALKRFCSPVANGAAPTHVLRKEARVAGVVRGESRIWRTMVGTFAGSVDEGTRKKKETRMDHIGFCDLEDLYIAKPVSELEAPHHIYLHAAT